MCACPTRWYEESTDSKGRTRRFSGGMYGFKCEACDAAWMFESGYGEDRHRLLRINAGDDHCEHRGLSLTRVKFHLIGPAPPLVEHTKRVKLDQDTKDVTITAEPEEGREDKKKETKNNPLGFNDPY